MAKLWADRSVAAHGGPAVVMALVLLVSAASSASAESAGGGSSPVYQRKSHAASPWGGRGYGGSFRRGGPPVASGWFQRPYPYHLDYYRMRYGGSYAPYFGNLYGTPNVVITPYYGGYGSYYSGYGAPPPGYSGGMVGGPPAGYPASPEAAGGAPTASP